MARNRRETLKGAFALLGAAVGLGADGASAEDSTLGRAPQAKAGLPLVFYGVRWRIASQDVRRGELPAAGVRMLARGEIVDKPARGRKLGDFFATYYCLNRPGKVPAHEPGSLELHTFLFPDGSIVGSGVASAGAESEGHFAIVGGTGRYHGARGSYVARQSFSDLGGDGTATFTLMLI